MSRLRARLWAEGIGTGLLLATVVGSGVMGVDLAAGNTGIALLANAAATACVLFVLISVLGPVSGAHFNPLVTLAFAMRRETSVKEAAMYVLVQIAGAILGVWLAHAMFGLPLWQLGTQVRSGAGPWLSEVVASAGLLLTILMGLRHRRDGIPLLVAAWIFAAYWFTASTSFANPVVTLARAFTDTFTGIRWQDVGGFVAAQLLGGSLAVGLERCLLPTVCRVGAAEPQG